MTALFDTNCHLDFPELSADLDEELARARLLGVTGWLVTGTEPTQWQRLGPLRKHQGVRLAVGIHPWWVEEVNARGERALDDALESLRSRALEVGAVALGECGLDRVRAERQGVGLELQSRAFEGQLALARELALPVVLHVVGAHGAALDVLRRGGPLPAGGVVHGFAGSEALARHYLSRGLHVGFGFAVTSDVAWRAREAASRLPLERCLLETDAPDQAPRGGRREGAQRGSGRPYELPVVARAVAELRGLPPSEVARRTYGNALALFGG